MGMSCEDRDKGTKENRDKGTKTEEKYEANTVVCAMCSMTNYSLEKQKKDGNCQSTRANLN